MLLFRCERLPEHNQQDDYDYYAIDITNRPDVIMFVTTSRNLTGLLSALFCRQLFNQTLSFVAFPPCDPETYKLRQVCKSECPKFADISSRCIDDVIKAGRMISEFAQLFDSYNCSNPSTYFPNASQSLYDSQKNCYTISSYNTSKCLHVLASYSKYILQ